MSSEKNISYDIVNTADLHIIVYSFERINNGYADTIFVESSTGLKSSYIRNIIVSGEFKFKKEYFGIIKIAYDKIVFASKLPESYNCNSELHIPLTSIKGLVGNIICHLRRK